MMPYVLLDIATWSLFIGRFHPLFVHLPIGFLLIAALLVIGRQLGKIQVNESIISFILFFAAIGSTLSCIAGYMLGTSGGYDEELLSDHQWKGIGVAVFSWIAWAVKSNRFGNKMAWGNAFYFPSFALATLLMLSAGHDGGLLTHGEGFLTQYTPEPFRALTGLPELQAASIQTEPIGNVQEAMAYQQIVKPVLELRCVQCHNQKKQKGDLRLDEVALMLKGGKNGPAFVQGNSKMSDMIQRCLLPENDDKRMPPKGKPALTDSQIALLAWWIDQGAPIDKRVSDLEVPESVAPILASLGKEGSNVNEEVSQVSKLSQIQAAPAKEADIEALRKTGMVVNTLAADQNLLEVNAVNAPHFGDQQMALLLPLAEQIVWLKLGGTQVTNAALPTIRKLKNLNKLHLEYTAVGDEGLSILKDLPSLEYLNVINTKLTEQGFKALLQSTSLKSIYVWQTSIQDSVLEQYQKSYPKMKIMTGYNAETIKGFLNVNLPEEPAAK
jgi:mono/diheme cytochrome c family protein/uncharacterized membrane protein